MASINSIKASDGIGNAAVATVQSTRSALATTIVVDTVANFPTTFHGSMGTPHTFVDPVTSEEITVISEATAVDFEGHIDGGDIEIDTIAPGYTDAGSAVGDIVIIRPTTQWADNVAETLAVAHDDDGTLKDASVHSAAVLADSVVATAKLANNAVTSAKLAAASSNSTPGTIADAGTSNTTGATLSLTAGTWFIIAKGVGSVSAAQRVQYTAEIYNSTGAAVLDTTTGEAEFVSGTMNADVPMTNICIVTLASASTVIIRYRTDDATGTAAVTNIKLIAIPVGV